MKTRLLIIIGIIATLMITSFVLYNSISMDDASRNIDLSKDETLLELYKDLPEVIAFYAKYDGAQVSVRENHVSYFAGNEDDFRIRMNLEFDENYEIDNIELHCYVKRIHQNEVAQSFILKYLKDYTCDEYGSQRTGNIQIRGDMADQICSIIGDECHPDPRLMEPNTVLIYSITDQSRTRIGTVPHDITIDLEKNDIVTWINESFFTATVYDREGTWSTGEFKPSMQKSIQFNKTGFYDYSVDAGDRHHGEIVAISDETNSLPIELRMKMGMSMVSGYRDNNPALIGVGIGATVEGVQITINQEELEKHDDAKSFYYNMYRDLIPFDVPITIEFGEPDILLTGEIENEN